jgi:hypothetical protein
MRREGVKSGSRSNSSVNYNSGEKKNKSRAVERQTARDKVKAHKSRDLVAFG